MDWWENRSRKSWKNPWTILIPMMKFDGCVMQVNPSEKNLRKVLTKQKDIWSMYLNHLLWKGSSLKFFKLLPMKKFMFMTNCFCKRLMIIYCRYRWDFIKTKYPKFYEFYNKRVSRTYHFHCFKCSNADCLWHEPIRFGKTANFGERMPSEIADARVKYILGLDPAEKLPSTRYRLHLLRKLQ